MNDFLPNITQNTPNAMKPKRPFRGGGSNSIQGSVAVDYAFENLNITTFGNNPSVLRLASDRQPKENNKDFLQVIGSPMNNEQTENHA
jgi:hypothetical protein